MSKKDFMRGLLCSQDGTPQTPEAYNSALEKNGYTGYQDGRGYAKFQRDEWNRGNRNVSNSVKYKR